MPMFMRYLVIIGIMLLSINASAADKENLYQQLPDDMVLGDVNAPVTIIEYASLSCPHCAHFHTTVFPSLKEKYVDTGKVKFIFRSFPLDLPALKGTVLAYCAGKDKFYSFMKVLFDTQSSWAFQKNFLEMLANIGKLGGIKADQFDRCMEDKKMEENILEGKLKGANEMEVKATPTFFINGKKFEGGHTIQEFSLALDAALKGEAKPEAKKAPKNAKEAVETKK